MRLTNKLRSEILADAIRDIFKKKAEAIIARANKLAVAAYDHEFGADVATLGSVKTKHDWTPNRTDATYLKNKDDQRVHLHTREKGRIYRPVKSEPSYLERELSLSSGCALGKTCIFPPHSGKSVRLLKADHIKRFEKLQADALDLIDQEEKLRSELYGFLYACTTRKELVANWPEGEKYLPSDTKPKKLPIPLVDNVRAAMAAK